MGKLIKPKRTGFIVVSNTVVRDERLTWKARGIFVYLWSQPKDWDFYEIEITKHSVDGRDALRSGLKELETYGYLKRKRIRAADGKVSGSDWYITDEPMWTEPVLENPTQVHPTLLNTNQLSTNKLNTNNKNHSPADAEPGLPGEVMDYFNERTGRTGKSVLRATEPRKRMINARAKEGYTLADFKKVIDNKWSEWHGTEMERYVMPNTLFVPKHFDDYLHQQAPAGKEEKPGYGGYQF